MDARSDTWSPHGFSAYRALYPATPQLEGRVRSDATGEFIVAWDQDDGLCPPADISCIFVRGLFGEWIPGHFTGPLRALERASVQAIIARSRASGTIAANAALIQRDIEQRIPAANRLAFLCHSKGGLDALALLARSAALRERTAAVVLCQTPRGGCAVLESVLLGRYAESIGGARRRVQEALARAAIAACGARPACAELTSGHIEPTVSRIDAAALPLPVVSVASWSGTPTAWLDSQHGRLQTIRPGCAHDGLFFVEQLLWPAAEQVLLPQLDHSQPTVGGAGFDHTRFWRALVTLALRRARGHIPPGADRPARGSAPAPRPS